MDWTTNKIERLKRQRPVLTCYNGFTDSVKRMSYHLKQHPDLQEQYQLCKGHQEKRIFFYDVYLLDPSVSEKAVLKKGTEDTNDIEDVVDDWMTAEEIADHKGIKPHSGNYEQKCLACVKGLPERDNEDTNLARQYKYCASKKSKQVIKKRRLEVQEEVKDVTSEDFAAMRTAMAAGPAQKMATSGGKGGKPDTPKPKEPEVVAYKHQAKKLKQQVTCIGSECHSLDVLVTSIEGQPDSEMKPVALKQLKALKEQMEKKKAEFLESKWLFPRKLRRMRLRKRLAKSVNW